MEDEFQVLPVEILHNILVRLPIKSLLRFKSVSKQWKRLILDPQIMTSRSRRMILLPVQPFHAMHINAPLHGHYMADQSIVNLRSPPGIPEGTKVTIVGTFHGIVLLLIHVSQAANININMMLYNPFTGAFKILADPPLDFHYSGTYVYGFGYGTTPHDLKILRLRAYKDAKSRSRPCDVLSLENGSWSSPLELIGDYVFFEYPGVFTNGSLFWIASDSEHRVVVVALDVKEMVFSEIQLPPNRLFSRFPLGKMNGRLCMICYESKSAGYYEVWALNEEDGVGKSWSFVNLSTSIWRGRDCGNDGLMCLLDEGKLVMLSRTSRRIIIYNLLNDTQIVCCVDLTNLAQVRSSLAIEYVESLMSPSDMCSGFV